MEAVADRGREDGPENRVIRVLDLRKVYGEDESAVHALQGVSFEIRSGEMCAIMGPSGSGKSTLMHILGCLDRPTSGKYFLDGEDVSGFDRDRLAEIRNDRLGFVFQSFNLLSRTTALENVELPLIYSSGDWRRREERAHACLELVGLADRARHLPNQLSGGQQQRVAIARALVNQPALLLADEPTGNLDSQTSIEIMGVFQKLNDAGITLVMVTHELDIARYTKRTVIMRDGRVVSDGPATDRLDARTELERLRAAQQAVHLQ
jgi:putative ABC transport system ATP-binding protein